jgi:hypothetical protein
MKGKLGTLIDDQIASINYDSIKNNYSSDDTNSIIRFSKKVTTELMAV